MIPVRVQDIARCILENLPEDKVPYWDYQAPGVPSALSDSSVAAITASALLELQQYVDNEQTKHYNAEVEAMLPTLLSERYLADNKENGGFILKHGVVNMPENSVDVPLSYVDYYFIEALTRCKALRN